MTESAAPALKDWFDQTRFEHIAQQTAAIYPEFDRARFLKLALPGLDGLSLLQRLRRMTESLHATLPADYPEALRLLHLLAPRINHNFVTLVLPDFVGLYGHAHFAASMEALKFFTAFGSSEFAIREFLRRDLARTLKVLEKWSRDPSEAVRRLASEGSRPRLPWSFRLDALVKDPSPAATILENLRADPSLYVRKSVANHLNDITKDHPEWVLERLEAWPRQNAHTAWIAKRALRSLIKKGDRRALALIGAGEKARVSVEAIRIEPRAITLGGDLNLSLRLKSLSPQRQRLVVDYVIYYVKKSGASSAKVFKFKEFNLEGGDCVELARRQSIRNFTTRLHYPGRHEVEIVINGATVARDCFELGLPVD